MYVAIEIQKSNLYNLSLESHVTSPFSIQLSSGIFWEIGVEVTYAKTFTSRGVGKTNRTIYSDLKGQECVRELHLNCFGVEALLLGLLAVKTSSAAQALDNQGVDFTHCHKNLY